MTRCSSSVLNMKLKRVCLLLFGVLFFLLLSEIKCISNYNHEKNLIISEEERRAAHANQISDQNNAETKLKRGLYATESHEKPQYPSGYASSGGGHIPAATFSNPGYSYGAPAPSGHFGSSYGYPSGHGSSSYGHGSSSYGHGSSLGGSSYGISSGGTGGGFGHSGHGGGYGPPSGHGGGHHSHSSLALKGLLIPLAGIALLGAAAALSTNPVLLQLGVVGKRRRRSLEYQSSYQDRVYPANPNVQPDLQ